MILSEIFLPVFIPVLERLNDNLQIFISPLYGSSKSFFIFHLSKIEKQIVVLLPDSKSCSEFNVELNELEITNTILITDFNVESLQACLNEIGNRNSFIIISTYELLNVSVPSKNQLDKKTIKISSVAECSYNNLIEYLNLFNYNKDKFVESIGDFSLRGSIIDFWSYGEKKPVRIEFDGDFIESIRYFDPENQRSTQIVDTVTLSENLEDSFKENLVSIFDYLNNQIIVASSYYLNQNNENQIIENSISEIESDNEFKDIIEELNITSTNEFANSKDDDQNNSTSKVQTQIQSFANQLKSSLLNTKSSRLILEIDIGEANDKIELGLTTAPVINCNYNLLASIILQFIDDGYRIFITTENEFQTKRMTDLLCELNEQISFFIDEGIIKIITCVIKEGLINKKEKFLLLSDYQIFNKPFRTKPILFNKKKNKKSKDISSILYGDFVVHEEFGIGKYIGLETIKIGEINQESMKLLFNEGGIVYVNLNYLHLVKKFSAQDGITPSLSTLGTSDWANTKKRTKKKIKDAAKELIQLYAKRKSSKGFAFSYDTIWQKELEASFFYEDTPDQEKVVEEIKNDMHAEFPMDRLVCGDVGFGKTEVAVRASFKAIQDGKQVSMLVPTTILAEQHFNTFSDRLKQFPVKVAVLSRFQSKSKQKEIVKELSNGKIDLIIGTHRLLSKDIQFKDLGLLIIDEEHRFGVMAKEKLKSIKNNVDMLSLSATPIPRTLNLSLLGARDLSIIASAPPNRQPIYTLVDTFDIKKIRTWILNELNRNGQVYIVHDRVESIEKLSSYFNKYIPEINIGIAHGQMKVSQLEDVFHGFLNKKFDVLLSTKIIESGLDIPNVNTIIVNRADRFGLAELHQLRGRVGRSDKQAYAYFLVPSLNSINKKTMKRLQAIEEFSELGAGFNLSMRDLEIRGAGNLLGTEQSGYINEIGFDLYIKLINEAVEELKAQEFKEIFNDLPKHIELSEPVIDTYFEVGIPENYIAEQTDRLKFYTSLYSIKSIDEINDLKEEMIDKFGAMPTLVKLLFKCAEFKFYASHTLFERIAIQSKKIIIILPKADKEEYYKNNFPLLMKLILSDYKDSIQFSQSNLSLKLVIENKFLSPEETLNNLIEFCKVVIGIFQGN